MFRSLKPRLWRFTFNHWPCYRRTGGRVTHISPDWLELGVCLPLNLRTRNYMGTIFGGSMFGAVDPFFMMMILKNLGPDYLVWDKAGTIRFKRPGRSTLHGLFRLTREDLEEIRTALATEDSVDRSFTVELKDKDGAVHAIVDKTMYIARKKPRPGGDRGGRDGS